MFISTKGPINLFKREAELGGARHFQYISSSQLEALVGLVGSKNVTEVSYIGADGDSVGLCFSSHSTIVRNPNR